MKSPVRASLLRRKMLRDMTGNWKSFVSVFIICMLSAMLFTSLDAAWRGMERNLDAQFVASGLADLWVAGDISDRRARDIRALDGVADAQRRVRVRGTADLPGEPDIELYMNEGDARVSAALVFEGSLPAGAQKNACVLDSRFAQAMGIKTGDTLRVAVDGIALNLLVGAIGYSPEYIVYSDGFDFRADPHQFGYAFVSVGTLGFLPYGETVVRLQKGADAHSVKQEIQLLLDDPSISILTREEKMGIRMAVEEVDQIRALGQVFPTVFFLVAALITWTTMKRLVDNQRMQIGVLSSLGYSQGQLFRHFMGYGLAVSALGAAFGLLGTRLILGDVVMWALRSIYNMPGADIYMHPGVMAGISALIIGIAMGSSLASCYKALKEVPAGLLRPRPPAHGKRIILERAGPLWRRMGFSAKLITRNMLRNTSRFLIGLLGAVGCSAMLLTGFGMRDSVVYVLDNYYTNTMRYDVRVDLEKSVTTNYLDSIRLRGQAQRQEAMMEASCELLLDGRWRTKGLYVLEDRHEALYLERGGQRIWLPEEGVVLTERTAEETGLNIGDSVKVRAPNGHTAAVRIMDVVSIQLGQGVYVSRTAWRTLDMMPFVPTALLLSGGDIKLDAIGDMDGVAKARTIAQVRSGNAFMVRVLDVVVLIMVLFSGALLLVVLFTLGQLNFFERIRELATLMVLGFYPRETKRLILRENIIIAVLGLPLGLYLGPFLHSWVLTYGFPTVLEFVPYIAKVSWVYTLGLTLLFAWLVNMLIGIRFKDVNMVEALKSVE